MKRPTGRLDRVRVLTVFALLFGASPFAFGQRAPFPIPDPDPEIERRSFVVADGFEVNRFAADPLIAKPLQINFDPAGRLRIASSEVYPQIKPGAVADDKVLIVEDRDHDGRADSTTDFARGLLIPTGIEPGDGGAYVANSTELLHLKDTDGDGKADATRVVLSGFGTEDTHHILHTLRWGYDGMLYFNQSIYIHSHVETPHGVRRLGGGGIWQFRPETMELEVFIRGLVNPWGHHFDRWGQSFATDGAGGEGINYCIPGAYYVTAPNAVRILKGLNPGSPTYCGLEVVSGRHFPESWRGSVLTNDFRGNRVCRFVLADDGAGYAAREQAELIKSNHLAFRPIDIKMGPDGAIYIADWYNPIIQHGEVDFRDPRRDHTRGRIWRVTARGRPLVSKPHLVGATIDSLLDELKAPEDWTRQQTKRVLKERGPSEVVPRLATWVKGLDPKEPEHDHHRLEALWTYQAIDVAEPGVDSLLEPGKAVKENYHAQVVATSDGKIYTGIKLRQTDSELVLRDAEDREVAIPVDSIEEQKVSLSFNSTDALSVRIDGRGVAFVSAHVARLSSICRAGCTRSPLALTWVAATTASAVFSRTSRVRRRGRRRCWGRECAGRDVPRRLVTRCQSVYTSRCGNHEFDHARARLRPSRHQHSTRTEPRPRGMSQSCPRDQGLSRARRSHPRFWWSLKVEKMPMNTRGEPGVERDGEPYPSRPACPVCGGGPLVEQRGKLVCSKCRTICEACCEGGRG